LSPLLPRLKIPFPVEEEDVEPEADETKQAEETILEERLSLNEQRLQSVVNVLSEQGASRILDLGCGEGKLLRELLRERRFSEIVGMDVSYRALEIAQERLGFDRMGENQRKRIQLIHGSLNTATSGFMLLDRTSPTAKTPGRLVASLTPRLWKERFAADPLRSAIDRPVKNAVS
jgi:SAM-dependent methyltransferase